MQLNKWTIYAFLLVLSTGCIEPFEPELDETSEVLVIDGRITDKQGIQTVRVSKSSPYSYPQFKAVTGCVVRVEDDEGYGITFMENSAGIYQSELEPGFLAVGKAYKLSVVTPEDQVYESEYDSLLACAPIDNLSYKLETQGTSNPDITYYGIRFYLDMKGSPEVSRSYMWSFEETWEYLAYYPIMYIWDGTILQELPSPLPGFEVCYLWKALNYYQVGSSRLSGINEIRQQPLLFVSNQTPRLSAQYNLLVTQHSLSNRAFLYWDRMKAQSGDSGGLFESQPSRIKGNISNTQNPEEKVLGYFFVSQVQEKRINVLENFDFPIARFNCQVDTIRNLTELKGLYPPYPYYMYSINEETGRGFPFEFADQECFNCTYRGGVTTKPDYMYD